ncbi:MAG: peptidase M14 [Planctomycetes bacterium]|nr:peptidase M14 [Planctomycetota bacterium]
MLSILNNALGSSAALRIAFAALMGVFTSVAAGQVDYQHPSKVQLAFNKLYNYDEVIRICEQMVAAYPEMLSLETIGQSSEGRKMLALTLNIQKTGPHDSKPALYIDANIHGNEVQGTEVVLYTIWYLTKSYGKVEHLTRLMDRVSFYFVPMVNPDGRAYWFDQPNTASSSRSGKKPTDNDGDGLYDEDPPNDLDGDGYILRMRREDPNGNMRESAEDYRLMVRVDRQTKGDFKRYTMLGSEGIDDDGDGRVNEDGPGGYDLNRNWPADWQPNYIQRGSGDYPFSHPETHSIGKFILARPNIAAAQSYHNSGGMILRGPGAEYVTYPGRDTRVYDKIAKRGEKLLPFYRYLVIWSGLYTVHGGTVNWTSEDLGIISFTNELWSGKQYYNRDERASQKERLEFSDFVLFGQTYVPWKKFNHPVYGEIELGGWRKMTGRVPPAFAIEEMCHRNFAFTMYHADQMPLVELRDSEVKSLGGNVWRVRVDAHNLRTIPTTTGQAAKRKYGPRDFLEISGPSLEVVAGGTLANRFTAPFEFVEQNPHKLWLDTGLRGDGHQIFQWIVEGSGQATVRFSSARAINVSTAFALRPE